MVERLGYAGVALPVALESLVSPVPSELILPLAGYLTGQGRLWYPAVVLAATVGSVLGALAVYGLAARLGEERVRRFVRRFGRYLLLGEADLDRAERWFDRHGRAAVALGHPAPLVRSAVSVPAGPRRMPLPVFLGSTALGAGVWSAVLVGIGWALGDRWQQVERYGTVLEVAVLGGLLVLAGRFVLRRLRRGTHAAALAQRPPCALVSRSVCCPTAATRGAARVPAPGPGGGNRGTP